MQNIIKFVNHSYDKQEDLKNLLLYALTDKKTGAWLEYVGGINVDSKLSLFEMMYVKKYFHKTTGRQIRHIIVSPDTDYFFRLTPQDLYYIALRISAFYGCAYQIVFGVHTDTEKIHIHFIMNTVSFIDGMMYSGNETDMDYFKAYAEAVILDYCARFYK